VGCEFCVVPIDLALKLIDAISRVTKK